MTRAHIISADGTRYEEVTAQKATRRKVIRRIIAGTATLATTIVLSAALIGLHRAEIAPATPSPTDIAILHQAEKANGKGNCHLEWNETQKGFEVICDAHHAPTAAEALTLTGARKACAHTTRGRQQGACLNLYMRHAWQGTHTYTPEGKVLVKECRAQYRGVELTICLEQEVG